MFDEQPDGDPHGECAAEIHRLTALLAAAARPLDAAQPIEWEPLEEIPRERQMFDRQVELWESPQKVIAVCLSVWASMNPGGSYAAQCNIMANEVAKLHNRGALSPSQGQGETK